MTSEDRKRIEYRKCLILAKEIKYGGYLELEIENPLISENALPGNFVMIRGWNSQTPVLPRPFDILECSKEKKSFKLVIKITGKGTELLAGLEKGDHVNILGSLGKGIRVPEKTISGKTVNSIGLLARGVGAAALVLLAEKAREAGIKVHSFITAAEKEKLVCCDYLEKYSNTLTTGWDRGKDSGDDGRELVNSFLKIGELDIIYTCGSRRFGKFVQEIDRQSNTDGYLFMESRMACGLGDCHGCTVVTQDDEYLLVCQDGPVFPAGKIDLDR